MDNYFVKKVFLFCNWLILKGINLTDVLLFFFVLVLFWLFLFKIHLLDLGSFGGFIPNIELKRSPKAEV